MSGDNLTAKKLEVSNNLILKNLTQSDADEGQKSKIVFTGKKTTDTSLVHLSSKPTCILVAPERFFLVSGFCFRRHAIQFWCRI